MLVVDDFNFPSSSIQQAHITASSNTNSSPEERKEIDIFYNKNVDVGNDFNKQLGLESSMEHLSENGFQSGVNKVRSDSSLEVTSLSHNRDDLVKLTTSNETKFLKWLMSEDPPPFSHNACSRNTPRTVSDFSGTGSKSPRFLPNTNHDFIVHKNIGTPCSDDTDTTQSCGVYDSLDLSRDELDFLANATHPSPIKMPAIGIGSRPPRREPDVIVRSTPVAKADSSQFREINSVVTSNDVVQDSIEASVEQFGKDKGVLGTDEIDNKNQRISSLDAARASILTGQKDAGEGGGDLDDRTLSAIEEEEERGTRPLEGAAYHPFWTCGSRYGYPQVMFEQRTAKHKLNTLAAVPTTSSFPTVGLSSSHASSPQLINPEGAPVPVTQPQPYLDAHRRLAPAIAQRVVVTSPFVDDDNAYPFVSSRLDNVSDSDDDKMLMNRGTAAAPRAQQHVSSHNDKLTGDLFYSEAVKFEVEIPVRKSKNLAHPDASDNTYNAMRVPRLEMDDADAEWGSRADTEILYQDPGYTQSYHEVRSRDAHGIANFTPNSEDLSLPTLSDDETLADDDENFTPSKFGPMRGTYPIRTQAPYVLPSFQSPNNVHFGYVQPQAFLTADIDSCSIGNNLSSFRTGPSNARMADAQYQNSLVPPKHRPVPNSTQAYKNEEAPSNAFINGAQRFDHAKVDYTVGGSRKKALQRIQQGLTNAEKDFIEQNRRTIMGGKHKLGYGEIFNKQRGELRSAPEASGTGGTKEVVAEELLHGSYQELAKAGSSGVGLEDFWNSRSASLAQQSGSRKRLRPAKSQGSLRPIAQPSEGRRQRAVLHKLPAPVVPKTGHPVTVAQHDDSSNTDMHRSCQDFDRLNEANDAHELQQPYGRSPPAAVRRHHVPAHDVQAAAPLHVGAQALPANPFAPAVAPNGHPLPPNGVPPFMNGLPPAYAATLAMSALNPYFMGPMGPYQPFFSQWAIMNPMPPGAIIAPYNAAGASLANVSSSATQSITTNAQPVTKAAVTEQLVADDDYENMFPSPRELALETQKVAATVNRYASLPPIPGERNEPDVFQPNPIAKPPPNKDGNGGSYLKALLKQKQTETANASPAYKQYTLDDYRSLNKDVRLPGSLGPDLSSEEYHQKMERRRKQLEYARHLQEQSSVATTLKRRPPGEELFLMQKPASKRDMALEYARTVSKPKPVRQMKANDEEAARRKVEEFDEDTRGDQEQMGDEDVLERLKLEELRLRHEREKAEVERIRSRVEKRHTPADATSAATPLPLSPLRAQKSDPREAPT